MKCRGEQRAVTPAVGPAVEAGQQLLVRPDRGQPARLAGLGVLLWNLPVAPVKRNRFIALDGAVKSGNRELEAKAGDLAGLKATSPMSRHAPTGRPLPGVCDGPTRERGLGDRCGVQPIFTSVLEWATDLG